VAVLLDPATTQDWVKKPGQWRRKGENGPPVVTDPNGESVRSGARKGEVKMTVYSRPSSFGKQVENVYNLQKWNERQGIIGLAQDDELLAEMRGLLDHDDRDTTEWKAAADAVFTKAKRAAGAYLKADQGSHGHALTEDGDLDRDIVARLTDGEDLGLPEQVQRQIVAAWDKLVADNDLEILAVEFACVHDRWRVAGTGDRLARLRRDLTFVVEGRTITLAAGTVIVLDIKTGGLKVDAAGRPNYWLSYAVQVAAYAGGAPYDVDDERRGTWPFEISQDHAVIAHIDIGRALATGEMVAQLIYVDLTAGRYAGDLVVACKDWQRRKDVFSPIGQHVVTVGNNDDRRVALRDRFGLLDDDAKAAFRARQLDPDDLDAIEVALDELDPFSQRNTEATAPPPAPRPEPVRPAPTVGTPPDEGAPGDPAAFKVLEAKFTALEPTVRSWIGGIARQAMDAGAPFGAGNTKTVRRFEIYRGLLALAEHGHDDDELVRELVATATESDSAFHPTYTTGYVVGAMHADQARRFADLSVALCDDVTAVDLRRRTAA